LQGTFISQPAMPGLAVYTLPIPGRRYIVGADPAEGNPNSDESALEVLDVDSGEEVAAMAGALSRRPSRHTLRQSHGITMAPR
jgi:hypothetical protein